MAIKYEIAKHASAFPSKCLASTGGKHIYNLIAAADTDNGQIVAKGEYVSSEYYTVADSTGFEGTIVDTAANGNYYVEVKTAGDACLIYTVPMIAEEYTNNFKKESNFYNATGDIMRAYELAVGDIFEVSKEAFGSGSPAKGASVTVTSKKLVVA